MLAIACTPLQPVLLLSQQESAQRQEQAWSNTIHCLVLPVREERNQDGFPSLSGSLYRSSDLSPLKGSTHGGPSLCSWPCSKLHWGGVQTASSIPLKRVFPLPATAEVSDPPRVGTIISGNHIQPHYPLLSHPDPPGSPHATN